MLGQRIDWRERFKFLSTRPVVGKLIGMESCPRSDESQRPGR
jgi:hypothetical protein